MASGIDRARIAAEQGDRPARSISARQPRGRGAGVLVNITVPSRAWVRETKEVMTSSARSRRRNATIIYAAFTTTCWPIPAASWTVVATGLGMAAARQPKPQLVLNNVSGQKTGTDNMPGPATTSSSMAVRRSSAQPALDGQALQQSGVGQVPTSPPSAQAGGLPGPRRAASSLPEADRLSHCSTRAPERAALSRAARSQARTIRARLPSARIPGR